MANTVRSSPNDDHEMAPADDAQDRGQQDSGERGSLRIGDKVAQRLALHAALSTPGVARHAAGLDKLTGRDLPSAQLDISSNRAAAQLKIAVTWPHPLAEVAAAVQRNVAEALHSMAGLQVDRVDVDVTHVSVTQTTPSRRVQ